MVDKKDVITPEEQEQRNKNALLKVLNECYDCGNPCIVTNGIKKCLWCNSEFVGGVVYGG